MYQFQPFFIAQALLLLLLPIYQTVLLLVSESTQHETVIKRHRGFQSLLNFLTAVIKSP